MAREKRKLHSEKSSKPMWPWLLGGVLVIVLLIVGIKLGGMFLDKVKKGDTSVKAVMEEGKDVVGEYEFLNRNGNTYKQVFLKNGIVEWYENGKKEAEDTKWWIVKEEIHVDWSSRGISTIERTLVYIINKDKSITNIATIRDGKRTDYLKEGATYKKIK